MSPEAQRIAIAEACGWTKCRLAIKGAGAPERGPSPYGLPPGRNYEAPITTYERDLNAMHEAEKVLKPGFGEGSWMHYSDFLRGICGGGSHLQIIHATAAQRAEAFLRTLNLWKE